MLWLKARDPALAVRVAKALYRAYFVDDIDISDPDAAAAVAATEGVGRGRRARGDRRSGDQGRAEARGRAGDRARRVRLAVRLRRRRAVLGARPLRPDRALARDRRILARSGGEGPMAEYTLHCFAQSGQRVQAGAGARARRGRLGAALRRLLQRRDAHARVSRDQRDGRGAGARASRPAAVAIRRDPRLPRRDARPVRARRRRRAPRDPALAAVRQPQADELHGDVPVHAHVRQGSRPGGARRVPPPRRDGVGRPRRAPRRPALRRRRPADDRRPLALRLPVLAGRDRRRLERVSFDPRLARPDPRASRAGCIRTS